MSDTQEIHNYPVDSIIKFKQPNRSFLYKVIKEGVYSNKPLLAYTLPPKKYQVPNDYTVETTWGRGNNQCTIRCSINYNEKRPIFQICFGKNFEYEVFSIKTATDAANLFHKKYTPQKGTKTSGVYLFGLQLKVLDEARKFKHHSNILKQVDECSNSNLTKRATNIGKLILTEFNEKVSELYHMNDIPKLESLSYSIKGHTYEINYDDNDKIKKKQKTELIVETLDKRKISSDSYRDLHSIEYHLPSEKAIYEERQTINKIMSQLVPILTMDVMIEEIDMNDESILQEAKDTIGKGVYRNIKNILQYLIPDLVQRNVLNPQQATVNLRISGDGRNVGRQVKHVMLTMAILDDKDTIYQPSYHYMLALYSGIEDYRTLANITTSIRNDLINLKNQGLIINNIKWNFQFYFSSDWKFLAICLGFNSAHSKNFCLWCTINKSQQGDLLKEWKISKKMDILIEQPNYYKGHLKISLFNMIDLDHWIPDELHIMLRITDRLWSLIIAELIEYDLFNDIARNIIIEEMKRINVTFQFWKNHESKNWDYTSLMGEDKLKVLQFFDLSKILPKSHASIIKKLWDKFYDLYIMMKDPNTKSEDFQYYAKNWLTLFLLPSKGTPNTQEFKKGLYQPNHITPYIHVLVHHISEFMTIHQRWGLAAFSCCGVEKKIINKYLFFSKNNTK